MLKFPGNFRKAASAKACEYTQWCAPGIIGKKAERVGWFGDRVFFYVGYIFQ